MPGIKTIFPKGADMRFPFTNRSDEDFAGIWGKKAYTFKAMTTTPMLGMIADASPLDLQGIRKKFAKDWAVAQFFKKEGRQLESQEKNADGSPKFNSIHMARSYTDADLAPYIQMCLEPLPESDVTVEDIISIPIEETLTRDEDGNLVTEAISSKTSLRKKALEA